MGFSVVDGLPSLIILGPRAGRNWFDLGGVGRTLTGNLGIGRLRTRGILPVSRCPTRFRCLAYSRRGTQLGRRAKPLISIRNIGSSARRISPSETDEQSTEAVDSEGGVPRCETACRRRNQKANPWLRRAPKLSRCEADRLNPTCAHWGALGLEMLPKPTRKRTDPNPTHRSHGTFENARTRRTCGAPTAPTLPLFCPKRRCRSSRFHGAQWTVSP
jgi:hypothetical protein